MNRFALCSSLRCCQCWKPPRSAIRLFGTAVCGPTLKDMLSLPVGHIITPEGISFMYGRMPTPNDMFVGYKFVEEPCGIMAQQGFGYLQVEFGERIGPEGRYEILRKLGRGMQSSIWLAKDHRKLRYVAIKALKGHATDQVKRGTVCEPEVLRKISASGKGMQELHCLTLLDEFVHPGKDEGDGEHLCLVTDPLGPSISSIKPSKRIIKKILRDVLAGLDHLHSLGVAHTDLHSSNILMGLGSEKHAFDIESYIKGNPSERHPPEETWGSKIVRVAKSQPFPAPPLDSLMSVPFVLSDFGSAQFIDKKITNEIVPVDIRPPEVILDLPWNEKVDIWTFGILAFELINKQKLFRNAKGRTPHELFMIYQALLFTEERLPAEVIRSSETAMEFLDPETGWLKVKHLPFQSVSLLRINERIGALSNPIERESATALMKKCLRINAKDRLSARELMKDKWLNEDV